jgi:hypothetical protein
MDLSLRFISSAYTHNFDFLGPRSIACVRLCRRCYIGGTKGVTLEG